MFRLLVRPQAIARVQAIKCLERHPAHHRLFSADSGPVQEDRGGEKGSTFRKRLWGRVFENDKPLADLRKEPKNHEIAIHKAIKDHEISTNKAISNLSTQMETGFAEMKTDFARLGRKISFIQWQIGLVGSALVAFLGFAGYAINKAMDAQVVTSATESKDASNGVKKK